jgi:hypothetical protein
MTERSRGEMKLYAKSNRSASRQPVRDNARGGGSAILFRHRLGDLSGIAMVIAELEQASELLGDVVH